MKMAQAEREKNLALVADMKYGAIPDLEKKIAVTEHQITEENEKQQDRLLTEIVGPNAIADIGKDSLHQQRHRRTFLLFQSVDGRAFQSRSSRKLNANDC